MCIESKTAAAKFLIPNAITYVCIMKKAVLSIVLQNSEEYTVIRLSQAFK